MPVAPRDPADRIRVAKRAGTIAMQRTMRIPRAADAGPAAPADLWTAFRSLRDARTRYGLADRCLGVLQAMVGVAANGKGTSVFLSNRELSRRAGGIPERTMRRCLARLVAAGVATRNASPNHKRFRTVDPFSGEVMAFGFDLTPLLARAPEFYAVAAEIDAADRNRRFLVQKIRVALHRLDLAGRAPDDAADMRRAIRRIGTGPEALSAMLERLEAALPSDNVPPRAKDIPTLKMAATDGRDGRHHHRPEYEDMDKGRPGPLLPALPDRDMAEIAMTACRDAMDYAPDAPTCWPDMERHAWRMAPMMQIEPRHIASAVTRLGYRGAALAILCVLQMSERIASPPAYFTSITVGKRSEGFDVVALARRMARRAERLTAVNLVRCGDCAADPG